MIQNNIRQRISLPWVKTELKNLIWERFYSISCEELKNADIIILSNYLVTFSNFFSQNREILPKTIFMPSFKTIGRFKEKLQEGGGGGICPPQSHESAKNPACLRLKARRYLFGSRYALFVETISVNGLIALFLYVTFEQRWENVRRSGSPNVYSQNPYVKTLNFEGQAAIGSYI